MKRRLLVTTLLLVLVAALLAGCGESDKAGGGSGSSPVSEGDRLPASAAGDGAPSGLEHVHGVGRNPADGSVMLATHYGLWRLEEGAEAELVGEYRHDLMGFSVVGADHFVASGHPNGAPDLPPHLGLIETTDGGSTWRSVSLLGKVDFHALHAGEKQTWGWNSQDGSLMVSDDGSEWDTRAEGMAMLDFAVAPDDPDVLVAGMPVSQTRLELRRSTDGGRTFTPVRDAPQLARFAWSAPEELVGFDIDGDVHRSKDAGTTWRRTGKLGTFPDAVAASGKELLAAAGGAVHRSTDGGRTWKLLQRYAD